MSHSIIIDQPKRESFIQKIASQVEFNRAKSEFTSKIFKSINTETNKFLFSVLNEISEDNKVLANYRLVLSEPSNRIDSETFHSIEKLKIASFKAKMSHSDLKIKLGKLLSSVFTYPNEEFDLNFLNSVILKSPQNNDKSKLLGKKIFGIKKSDWEKKFSYDEKNLNLSIFKGDKRIQVCKGNSIKNFALESKIECFDMAEMKNSIAVGCQNGQVYVIDKHRDGDQINPNPLMLRFPNASSSALTKIKYSSSGEILCFSNFNNQVFVYKDNVYESDCRVEPNSLKISVVSFICATDQICFVGTKEGGLYFYPIKLKKWTNIRLFVNYIDNIIVSLDNKYLIVSSDKEVKVFEIDYHLFTLCERPIWENIFKNSVSFALVKENYGYLVVFEKKSANIFDIKTGKLVQEVKGLIEYAILCSQYQDLLKFWYLME